MPLEIDLRPVARFGLNLDQYFGLWAVEAGRFLQMFEQVSRLDLAAHVEASQGPGTTDGPETEARAPLYGTVPAGGQGQKSVAVIEIEGTLTKRGSSFSDAGSTIYLRRAVRAAARDPEIGAILLVIDSPGGTTAGTDDLAREVMEARDAKPVYAFVEDLAASAAYWVASQAERIYANNATALVGSIGTYIGLYDYSALAAKEGIRPVVIKSGKFKAAGFSGTEVTDEQKAYFQGIVDKTQAEFSRGVAEGRKLPMAKVEELADGRVHVASDAQALGLVDGIQSLEATIVELQERLQSQSRTVSDSKRTKHMSQDNQSTATPAAPQPATFAELKSGCLGADAEFLCHELERGATLAQAQTAWMAEQHKRLESAQKAAAEAQARAKRPGVEALGTSGLKPESAAGEDAVAAFNEAVATKVKAGMPKDKAIRAVVHENPDLHLAYLAQHNAAHGRKAR